MNRFFLNFNIKKKVKNGNRINYLLSNKKGDHIWLIKTSILLSLKTSKYGSMRNGMGR
jgi:hypothetical protein